MKPLAAFFALSVAVLCGLAALLVLPLLEYVLAAGLFAVVLRPAYDRLEPWLGSRIAALVLTGSTVTAGIVPLVLISLVVHRSAVSAIESVDGSQLLANGYEIAREDLGVSDESIAAVEAAVRSELDGTLSNAVELTLARAVDIVAIGIDVVVGMVVLVALLYYLLVDGPALVDWLRTVTPLESRVLEALFTEVHGVIWAVLRSHVFVAIVQGILGGAGLALLGVPYATTLAAILVFAAFLPTIGVWLVWGPVTLAHGAASDPVRGVLLLGYGIGVLTVADSYLRAVLVNWGSDLHPALALLGVIGGLSLFGVIGLFVGPVVLAVLKATVTVFYRTERFGPEGGSSLERANAFAETE
ncbi:AI-2E family transporter [Natrinema longum]|uniref:AI-2E family transporter n=1 Tax=Natrinema longum TaxID=370324 RepID=A0A8A2UBY7_9EURY|nr:AI-2E family transporter [Natrinema longum]MBZ6496070.1 AI-2E family transporter [Natrinema longum]QSW86002.1 AI-2E family transporter [Natrinema longum]